MLTGLSNKIHVSLLRKHFKSGQCPSSKIFCRSVPVPRTFPLLLSSLGWRLNRFNPFFFFADNFPPKFTYVPKCIEVTLGEVAFVNVTASDNDSFTFSVLNIPNGANISSSGNFMNFTWNVTSAEKVCYSKFINQINVYYCYFYRDTQREPLRRREWQWDNRKTWRRKGPETGMNFLYMQLTQSLGFSKWVKWKDTFNG